MTVAAYVLLDASNVVLGLAQWDGVAPYNPPGVVTKHLLPANPPMFRLGDTYDPNTDLVTPRPDTPIETNAKNAATLLAQASTALANNTAYLAIGAPTQAQAITQVGVLTRQVDALIRLAMNQLQSTAGT